MTFRYAAAFAALAGLSAPAIADPASPDPLATIFGARENVIDISLSPDGEHIAHVAPGPGHSTLITVIDVATSKRQVIGKADGEPLGVASCGWSSNTRIVCKFHGVSKAAGVLAGYSRTMGFDLDGGNSRYLGRRVGNDGLRLNQFDGDVIDWRAGDGQVLMTRDWIPEDQRGGFAGSTRDGLGVELVDTVTGKGTTVEPPAREASDYIADGQGNVRIRVTRDRNDDGLLTGTTLYHYRMPGSRSWQLFGKLADDDDGFRPIAVDGTRNTAFAVRTLDGRDALYSVALDGSMKAELVSSNPKVDVHSVVTIGRHGRVIGASYTTDRRHVDYFDPDYKKLAAALARVLPRTPIIQFMSADADEKKLLVYAGSDIDPGHYYIFTRANRHLDEMVMARPALDGRALTEMKHIRFAAADGTMIPAYLTLPPGGTKGLPAIVMPHGGPAARDEWGFDWLVQYFAQSGYAVIQPQYRGSAGYGDAWFANNGFRSWQLAIGDVLDAGRWLVKEGVADPARLGIVGWSYGGYAALQANVIDPALFKAVVAIAPVTDLGMTKEEAQGFTNQRLVERQIGSGPNIGQGSPARHADRFTAPVLLFHGDQDLNVGVAQSKAMDAALRRARKASTLAVFPKLDHQLDDTIVRTQMLDQAGRFLLTAMPPKAP